MGINPGVNQPAGPVTTQLDQGVEARAFFTPPKVANTGPGF